MSFHRTSNGHLQVDFTNNSINTKFPHSNTKESGIVLTYSEIFNRDSSEDKRTSIKTIREILRTLILQEPDD
jgi:hypothetical protein